MTEFLDCDVERENLNTPAAFPSEHENAEES